MTNSASDLVAGHIQSTRRRQGLTGQQLADRCAAIGARHLTAAVIANIETGRRDRSGLRRRDVTVDELLAVAVALDVPPASMFGPHDRWPTMQVTPDIHADPADMIAWIKGESTSVVPSLLGGLVLCGACQTAVLARRDTRGTSYFCTNVNCPGPRVNRPGEAIDAYVTKVAIERLKRTDAVEAIYPNLPDDDGDKDRYISDETARLYAEMADLDTEIGDLKQRRAEAHKQLEELADHPHLSAEVIARTLTSFSQKIERLEQARRKKERQTFLMEARSLVEDFWEKLPLTKKRAVIDLLMTVTLVSDENANKRAAAGRTFDPDDVQIGPPHL